MPVGTPPASQPPTRARIVVVEDDNAFQDLLDTVLTAEGYTVLRWTQGAGADAFIRDAQPVLLRAATGAGRRPSEQGADLFDQHLDLIGFI